MKTNSFIQTVENQIKLICQLSEFDVIQSFDNNDSRTEVTFVVTPVCYGIFSEVVVNILIDVAHRFGFSYYFSSDIINNKPKFVMYTPLDVQNS